VVCEICFFHFLSGNGNEIGRLGSFHDGFNEGGGGGIYDINNFFRVMT
jgi:hypothetical protein